MLKFFECIFIKTYWLKVTSLKNGIWNSVTFVHGPSVLFYISLPLIRDSFVNQNQKNNFIVKTEN